MILSSQVTVPPVASHWSTVFVPTNPSETWACVSAIAAIGVFVVAIFGLRSIRLSRTAMVTQAERESRLAAISRCEEFAAKLIPLNAELLYLLAGQKIDVFVKDAKGVSFNPDRQDHLEAAKAWVGALDEHAYGAAARLLNELEAWSMYFTSGLADSKLAYGPCAPILCSIVVQLYAVLLLKRADEYSGKYPNLVRLYLSWIDVRQNDEKRVKVTDLIKQLKDLQHKGPSGYYTLPDPIGTKVD